MDKIENSLATARKKAGLTQSQLAKQAGVNVMMISRIEREERLIENTTLATAIKLADALSVENPRDLMK